MLDAKFVEIIKETFKETQRAAIESGVTVSALVMLLLEKGVFTQKEWETARAVMAAVMDQELANNPGILR